MARCLFSPTFLIPILSFVTINGQTIYDDCDKVGSHFCFGSKFSSYEGTTANQAIGKVEKCIANKDCFIIVHAQKLTNDSVTIRIGAIPSSFIYAGFVQQPFRISSNNIPMDVPMMQMEDRDIMTHGGNAFTTIGVVDEDNTIESKQNYNGIGYGDGEVDRSTYGTTGLIFYTFNTTTNPDLRIDLVRHQLIPFVFRFHTSGRHYDFVDYELEDRVIGSPVVIFPSSNGVRMGNGIVWSWIVAALALLLIVG